MKTLLFTVGGDDDYQAMEFEEYSIINARALAYQRYLDMCSEDTIDEFNHLVVNGAYKVNIPCKLQVIKGIIPKEFIKYIRDEVQEYDSTKSKQFYLFEVE